MSLITRYSNWCYYDQLDGINLFNGEILRITWPDGAIGQVQVRIEQSTFETQDHGSIARLPVTTAFFDLALHGALIPVRLFNMEAERTVPPAHFEGARVHFRNGGPSGDFEVIRCAFENSRWVYRCRRVHAPPARPTVTHPPNFEADATEDQLNPDPAPT